MTNFSRRAVLACTALSACSGSTISDAGAGPDGGDAGCAVQGPLALPFVTACPGSSPGRGPTYCLSPSPGNL